MNKKADEDNNMTTKENSAENPMPGSDKDFAPFPNSILPHITPDDNSDGVSIQLYNGNTSNTHNINETSASPLLWRMLQVPGFTKAMIADIRGERVTLYSHMNGVPMRLYRKVADVAAWLGVELAPALPVFAPGDVVTVREAFEYDLTSRFTLRYYNRSGKYSNICNIGKRYGDNEFLLHVEGWTEFGLTARGEESLTIDFLNAADTLEVEAVDPIVIDEPAIDPDDTEIMPCPDVAEWEDLRGLNVTPWVSAGETDFTEPQDAYINGAKLDALEINLKKGTKGVWNIQLMNATDEQRKQAMVAVTNALVFDQSVGKWLDTRFVPYAVNDPNTGLPRTLSLIDRLNEHEAWLIEELAAAREQLEALRVNTAISSQDTISGVLGAVKVSTQAAQINPEFQADADNPQERAA